jgi:DNA-directed RNA polymerase subunit RPC12/RpoP
MSAETAKVDGEAGTVLKCKRCGTVWAYRGSAEYKAECPECGTSVVLKNRKMVPVEEINDVLTGGT